MTYLLTRPALTRDLGSYITFSGGGKSEEAFPCGANGQRQEIRALRN